MEDEDLTPEDLLDEIRVAACDLPAARSLARRLRPGHGDLGPDPGSPGLLAACTDALRRDGDFDLLPTVLQGALCPEPIHQDHDLEAGVSTSTSVCLEGVASEKVVHAITEISWDVWWAHGRVWNRREIPSSGGVRFDFSPVPFIPVRVEIELDPPVETHEEVGGLRRMKRVLESRFTGNFVGPARFEVLDLPDGSVLRAAWLGIRPGGWTRLLTRHRMAVNHMASERGEMPFAKGGGYPGLLTYLRRP